ncbi:MAG: sensor histidine kinase [Oscillospiraceae bacterium]|nr:sensor histidine kinase [Oscillospiraceae bacterium]
MMQELSLNVLDVAENSVSAGASLIEVEVWEDPKADLLTILIRDNGCGMTEEQVRQVTDPFYTTRKTRKVGLGVPFFKLAAELTGGSFSITSEVGKGTETKAVFVRSSIDRMPLGDMAETMVSLIGCNPDIDFIYRYGFGEALFEADTREFREILGDVSLAEPQVRSFIREFITENMKATGETAVAEE